MVQPQSLIWPPYLSDNIEYHLLSDPHIGILKFTRHHRLTALALFTISCHVASELYLAEFNVSKVRIAAVGEGLI